MKHHSITYTPSAKISFTRDELLLMLECSIHHYDGRCKDMSQERNSLGHLGLIRVMLSSMDAGLNDPFFLSYLSLDTLAKVVEVGQYMEDDKATRAFALRLAIKRVLIELNESEIEPKVIAP